MAPVDVLLPFDTRRDELFDLAVAALEALGRHGPVALAAFLVRRRRAQLDRPVGPHQRLVLGLGRLRQQFELRDRRGAVTIRRSHAIGTGIAAADDHDVLAGGHQLVRHRVAGDDLVLLRQEIHREHDTVELAARHVQVARRLGAARQDDGIEIGEQLPRPARRRRRARWDGIRHPRPTSAPCVGRSGASPS